MAADALAKTHSLNRAGEVGPDIYAEWRASTLGSITESLEMEHVGGFPASSRLVGQRLLEARTFHDRARAAHRRDRRRPARRSAPWSDLLPALRSGRAPNEATRPILGRYHDCRGGVYRDAGY